MNILKAIGYITGSLTRTLVKAMGSVEDVVDVMNITTKSIVNDSLEDAGITKEQLNTDFLARLEPIKVTKPTTTSAPVTTPVDAE